MSGFIPLENPGKEVNSITLLIPQEIIYMTPLFYKPW
jgi:hypothetical protein